MQCSKLYLACYIGVYEKVVKYLLNKVDPNVQNKKTLYYPIHLVCVYGYTDILKLLLYFGARKDVNDADGKTPTQLAIEYKQLSILEILNKREEWSYTPRCRHSVTQEAHYTYSKYTRNVIRKSRYTPLQRACFFKELEEVSKLLVDGANPNEINETEKSYPLHLACQNGAYNVVCILIEFKADVDARDGDGNTPLMIAMVNDCRKITDLLMQNNATPRTLNNNNQDIFVQLCKMNKFDLIRYYHNRHTIDPYVGFKMINIAASDNNMKLAECLLEIGITVPHSAMRFAALNRNFKMCMLFKSSTTCTANPFGIEISDAWEIGTCKTHSASCRNKCTMTKQQFGFALRNSGSKMALMNFIEFI